MTKKYYIYANPDEALSKINTLCDKGYVVIEGPTYIYAETNNTSFKDGLWTTEKTKSLHKIQATLEIEVKNA